MMIAYQGSKLIFLQPQKLGETDILVARDESGLLLPPEEVKEIIRLLNSGLEGKALKKAVEKQSIHQNLLLAGFDLEGEGIYSSSSGKVYRKMSFKNAKGHWGFKCKWCGDKVHSSTHEHYYDIYWSSFLLEDFGRVTERACSEDCIRLLWKERFNEVKKENELKYQEEKELGLI